MRFDDLDPIPPPRPERRVRLRRARDRMRAKAGSLRPLFTRMGRRSAPAIAWTRERGARLAVVAWRLLVRAFAVVGDAGRREARRAAAGLVSGLPTGSKDRRAILAAAGALI